MLALGGPHWPPELLRVGLSDALRASFGLAATDAAAVAAAEPYVPGAAHPYGLTAARRAALAGVSNPARHAHPAAAGAAAAAAAAAGSHRLPSNAALAGAGLLGRGGAHRARSGAHPAAAADAAAPGTATLFRARPPVGAPAAPRERGFPHLDRPTEVAAGEADRISEDTHKHRVLAGHAPGAASGANASAGAAAGAVE